jgi:hypothetical protein
MDEVVILPKNKKNRCRAMNKEIRVFRKMA